MKKRLNVKLSSRSIVQDDSITITAALVSNGPITVPTVTSIFPLY